MDTVDQNGYVANKEEGMAGRIPVGSEQINKYFTTNPILDSRAGLFGLGCWLLFATSSDSQSNNVADTKR